MTVVDAPSTAIGGRPRPADPRSAARRRTPAHLAPRRRAQQPALPAADARDLRRLLAGRRSSQSVVMSFQKTNLVTPATLVGLRQLRPRAPRPAVLGRPCSTPSTSRCSRCIFGYPAAAPPRRADERGAAAQGPLQRARLPAGRRPAGRRGAALEVLLRREPDRRLQHDPRLGRHPAAALDPERSHGDAVARARGDLGGGRRHDHHLPRRAAPRVRPSSTTPPRWTARASGARSGTSPCRSCAASCSSC